MEEFITDIFFVSLLCGFIFLIAAAVMYYFPPKNINLLYGYRTPASMKSKDRWDFAQRFSTIQMIKGSIVLITVSLCGYFIDLPESINVSVGIVMIVIMVAYLFITTERAIRKRFSNIP